MPHDSDQRVLRPVLYRLYLPQVQACLDAVDTEEVVFDLCLFNAGMDPHEGSADGGLQGITNQMLQTREKMVFDWCRLRALPVAFVLAGGYIGARLDAPGLVALHRLTLAAAATPVSAEKTV